VLAAQLHDQASGRTLPPGFERHALDADGLVGDEPWWGRFWDVPEHSPGEAALFDDARRSIHRALVAYGTDTATFGLIHADLLPQNILVQPDGLAVIDFDDAAFGWHLHDLSVALVQYVHHERFPAIRDALVAGYRSVRPLDERSLALLPTFLLARTFAEIGWYDTRLGGHVSQRGSVAVTRADAIPWRIRSALEQCEVVLPTLA
jgi:Ser/Thr protein kinase RdoA (MazF antagonist)